MRLKKLSDDFIKKVIEITAGKISPEVLEDYFKLLTTEIKKYYYTKTSESNLLRIIKSQYDISFFITEGIKYPHHIEILVSVSANSNYLSDVLVINPEYFYWIVNPSILKTELDENIFAKDVKEKIKHYKTLDAKVNALKNLKRKELLRIGLKDILNLSELSTIVNELSILANVLTAGLFNACLEFVFNKHQVTKLKSKYCIVALGKLGGMELNYSSDIDLLVFYDEDVKTKNKYYSQLLIEAIQLMIQKAAAGSMGFLYRIDLRLRPEGKYSALCKSINEYLNYYESRGEDWERQMLIKANYLGGSKTLYKKFIDYLIPFIYPGSFSSSPLEQIKRMKNNIERNLKSDENIKLSAGGIRDIEFPVQALQLINGGKHKELRTGNTISAISILEKKNLLSKNEADQFEKAYILYRKIEHFLQLMNDRQTHVIPAEGELAEQISSFLKYKNLDQFNSNIEKNKTAVRKIYNSIINSDSKKTESRIGIDRIKFSDLNRARANLAYLHEGKGLVGDKSFDKKSVSAFNEIEKLLFDYLEHSILPDKILDNFVRIIKFAGFPSIWYKEFREQEFFNAFLKLCEFSQQSVDFFAEDKKLRELFLSRAVFKSIEREEIQNTELKEFLFIVSVQVCTNYLDPIEANKLISEFVLFKLKSICDDFSNNKKWNKNYFVCALGSTGSSEMTFASDIDLIFVVENITEYPGVQSQFPELLSKIRTELNPFTVDCRLRPEGKSSQLVWDLASYQKYFSARARIWELQSFMKINIVSGSEKLFSSLLNSIQKRKGKEDKKSIIDSILDLRKKITPSFSFDTNFVDLKKSAGGLTDIEYSVQYLVLISEIEITSIIGKSVPQLIELLLSSNSKYSNELNTLIENYKLLKSLELANQIIFNVNSSKFFGSEENFKLISGLLNFDDAKKLEKNFTEILKSNRSIFNKILQ